MKSETLVKIKENRKRYFQEIRKAHKQQETHLNAAFNSPEPISVTKKRTMDLKNLLPSIKLPTIGFKTGVPTRYMRGVLLGYKHRLVNLNTKWVEFLHYRTEKIRSRAYSFLLVLFDA